MSSNKKIKTELIIKRGHKCQSCLNTEWLNKPITLELDHIDGDNKNNLESNLRLLCPNCHSFTDTWKGRNITKEYITDDAFLAALESTKTIKEALLKLNLTPKGRNYERASRLLNLSYKEKDVSNSQWGTIWINNGKENKKIKKDNLAEYENVGWKSGRIINTRPPSVLGKRWITNGHKSALTADNNIPEGWWPGRC